MPGFERPVPNSIALHGIFKSRQQLNTGTHTDTHTSARARMSHYNGLFPMPDVLYITFVLHFFPLFDNARDGGFAAITNSSLSIERVKKKNNSVPVLILIIIHGKGIKSLQKRYFLLRKNIT